MTNPKVALLVGFLCLLPVAGSEGGPRMPAPARAQAQLAADLIQPEDLVYLGAFRLPDVLEGEAGTWEYSGQALTYFPGGDPGGEGDGYPGSLFGTGHDVWNYVSEISIPAPATSRQLDRLEMARTIQPFHDVRAGLFDPLNEIPRVGMYLPPQGARPS